MSNKYSFDKNIFYRKTWREVCFMVGKHYWNKMRAGTLDAADRPLPSAEKMIEDPLCVSYDAKEYFRELGSKLLSGTDSRCKIYEGEKYYRLTFK